jgi:hypothetical protein
MPKAIENLDKNKGMVSMMRSPFLAMKTSIVWLTGKKRHYFEMLASAQSESAHDYPVRRILDAFGTYDRSQNESFPFTPRLHHFTQPSKKQ